jgi:hypothetical protein
MAQNLKVLGHTHLVRKATSPGVLVNTNNKGYTAFLNARKNAQKVTDLEDELAVLRDWVSSLQDQIKGN